MMITVSFNDKEINKLQIELLNIESSYYFILLVVFSTAKNILQKKTMESSTRTAGLMHIPAGYNSPYS